MNNIKKAIIMAAGNGTRLSAVLPDKPKGCLELAGLTIIERSIRQLLASDIQDIVMVIGYAAEQYEALLKDYNQVHFVRNDNYANSNSMASLYYAKEYGIDDFLLLESDLVYEQRSLTAILNHNPPNAILTSGYTYSDDEVYVCVDGENVMELKKQPSGRWPIVGELVGISKVSAEMYQAMLTYAEAYFQQSYDLCYEDCINGIATEIDVSYCKVEDLIWSEIDTPAHLERVQQKILPQLMTEWQIEMV